MQYGKWARKFEYIIKVEPYWNVNKVDRSKDPKRSGIKVEPYWNVNSNRAKVGKS